MKPLIAADSSFAPLRSRLFLMLWAATVLSNIGGFIRDVGTAWLVTDLSPSPLATALVQAATTLPVFLFALPAGVLSDILDKRKFLIAIQIMLASVSLCLMALSWLGLQSVATLILLTFIGGVGAALMGPTWQAVVPELVERPQLGNAVALNSLGINIARAIGPALGGAILLYFGVAYAYGADVLSYVFVIIALILWKREARQKDEIAEHFGGAFRAGLRYVKASRELHLVLFRAMAFFLFASAVWAILPLVARQLLKGSAGFYGVLLGAVGAGAIAGAILLPRLRKRWSNNQLITLAALVMAAVMVALSFAPSKPVAVGLMLILGIAWIVPLTTFNSTAQSILPNWVRGRSLAVYLTVFSGTMALGSVLWGTVAQMWSIPVALLVAGALLALVTFGVSRFGLPSGGDDLMPSGHWATVDDHGSTEKDRGPVLVQIEYRIRAEDREAFLAALKRLSRERLKDGAYQWSVGEDHDDPTILMEWFVIESWAEHLRQHHRVSRHAEQLQADVNRFHQGKTPPVVRHLIGFQRV